MVFKKVAPELSKERIRISIFKIRYVLVMAAVLVSPQIAWGQADLFISPSSGTYKTGELFSALIAVNTGGEAVNAASGQLNFDNQKLEVTDIGYNRSIFTLWTEEPSFSNAGGTVKFSGGLPSPGYTGASGAILRVTFKTKSSGQAALAFISGSVLANDGKGTNILDGLRGAVYSVVAAAEKPATPSAAPALPSAVETAEKLISAPTLTEWPKSLEEGTALTIKGLGFPDSKILLVVQKGSENPIIEERFTGEDGRFTYNFSKTVTAGFYRVWAKNVTPEGITSAPSEIVTIEVIKPLFFRIGSVALNYASIIVTLVALLVLAVVIIGWSWLRFRRWQRRRGQEVSEAEKSLHLGFDKLREGLGAYIEYLTDTKSASGVKNRALKTRQDLKTELEDIEKTVEKEIEDIEKRD